MSVRQLASGGTPRSVLEQSVIVLIYSEKKNQHSHHGVCNQLKVVVAVGALVCCAPSVCSVHYLLPRQKIR